MSRANLLKRKYYEKISSYLFLAATSLGVVALLILLFRVVSDGFSWFDWQFITSFPSRFPEKAGVLAALIGSVWVIGFTTPIAFMLGLGTALYLEEYAKKSWLTQLIKININNLAGVPSIVYGILGLGLFVKGMMLGSSVLAGALTMALLVLPIIIIASGEALRSVPQHLRHASYALGATKWQTVFYVVLPAAFPSILTGMILAMSRAIGETAPLIVVGALAFVSFIPVSPMDSFTVLPIQIFNWASRPQEDFRSVAAAGIMVLLLVLLSMNAIAVFLRNKYQNRL